MKFQGFLLVALLLILLSCRSSQGTTLSFLSLGSTANTVTETVPAFNDAVSGPIEITGGLWISGRNVTTAYISENGAISFEEGVTTPPQEAGASIYQDANEVALLAPFWTDYDLGADGMVRYEFYEPDGSQRTQRLELVSGALVNQTEGLDRFDARWMLLVEWRDCQPRGNTAPGNSNTFQAIAITDNSNNSYTIFIYRCDLIQWPGSNPNFAKIGINFGGGMELVHNLSGIETASDIDCINNATGSEVVNVVYNLDLFGQILSPSVTATPPDPTAPAATPTQSESEATSLPSPSALVHPTNTVESLSDIPTISEIHPTSSFKLQASATMSPTQGSSSLSTSLLAVAIAIPVIVIAAALILSSTIVICIVLSKTVTKSKIAITPYHDKAIGTDHHTPKSPAELSVFSAGGQGPLTAEGHVGKSQLNTSQAPLVDTEVTELNSPVSVHPQSFSF